VILPVIPAAPSPPSLESRVESRISIAAIVGRYEDRSIIRASWAKVTRVGRQIERGDWLLPLGFLLTPKFSGGGGGGVLGGNGRRFC